MNPKSTCSRTILALPWLVNGSLPAADRREVREHLIFCPACREELARTRMAFALFTSSVSTQGLQAATGLALQAAPKDPRGRAFRFISWAAAAAVVFFSFAGVWTLRDPNSTTAAGSKIARSSSLAQTPGRQPEQIFKDNFDSGTPSGWR